MIEVRESPQIVYDYKDNIFVKESFLDETICDKLIEENNEATISGKPIHWKGNWNKCDLDINHTIHNELDKVWEDAQEFYGTKLQFVEKYHLKKYTFGNFYGNHVDNYVSVTKRIDRKLSLVVQLSDENEYGAGDLVIVGNVMTKKKGSVIIFPSAYTHEVKPIGFGTRWVLIAWGWGSAI